MKKSTSKIFSISLLALLLLVSITSFAQEVQDAKYSKMLNGLLEHNVTEVYVKDLSSSDSKIIYLDAREKIEYNVSHIEGAKWIGYETFSMRYLAAIPKDAKIVVYCSVGYRSEKITQQLNAKGYKDVSNLYGGLFEWSNQEKPLVDNNGAKTTKIHPYDKEWGKWVTNGTKSYK